MGTDALLGLYQEWGPLPHGPCEHGALGFRLSVTALPKVPAVAAALAGAVVDVAQQLCPALWPCPAPVPWSLCSAPQPWLPSSASRPSLLLPGSVLLLARLHLPVQHQHGISLGAKTSSAIIMSRLSVSVSLLAYANCRTEPTIHQNNLQHPPSSVHQLGMLK